MRRSVKPQQSDVGYGLPESSFNFHEALRRGFAAAPDTRVYSLIGRPLHPSLHEGLFWPAATEKVNLALTVHHVSVLNVRIRVIKQLWVGLSFFFRVIRWRSITSRSSRRVLVIDAAFVSALPWVSLALVGSGVQKTGIFADVYSYMGNVSDARGPADFLRAVARRFIAASYARLDGFILLTKHMNDVVNPHKRPSMIMEGMVGSPVDGDSVTEKFKAPTIVYAGALRAEYGLDDLLSGFIDLGDDQAELLVFGAGPFERDILEASHENPRIKFGGRIPVEMVMTMQRKAWILANTRRVDDEFTKYSFPSKLLSYMASGTAVVTTRLPGMPSEYDDFVYLIDRPGSQGVTDSLRDLLGRPLAELNARGADAARFIAEHKNNKIQTQRILDFAQQLPTHATRRRIFPASTKTITDK